MHVNPGGAGYECRDRVFNPIITVWTFVTQVISADKSCRRPLRDWMPGESPKDFSKSSLLKSILDPLAGRVGYGGRLDVKEPGPEGERQRGD